MVGVFFLYQNASLNIMLCTFIVSATYESRDFGIGFAKCFAQVSFLFLLSVAVGELTAR